MDIYLKVTVGILIAAILTLMLSHQSTGISLLLTIAVCCMVITAVCAYLHPVLEFVRRLITVGSLNNELLNVLFKVVGIGLISQTAGLICADAGNQSLAKVLQIMTTAVIVCISVPVLEEMLSLIEMVLGEV